MVMQAQQIQEDGIARDAEILGQAQDLIEAHTIVVPGHAEYASKTVAITAQIPSSVSFLRTAGRAAPGDGGTGLHKRVAAPNIVKPWHFQSADSAWWEFAEDVPTLKYFGAVSGGAAAANRQAFRDAVEFAKYKGGGHVNLGPGSFEIDQTVILDYTDRPSERLNGIVGLRGAGVNGTELIWAGAADQPMILLKGEPDGADSSPDMKIGGFKMRPKVAGQGTGIQTLIAAYVQFNDILGFEFDTHFHLIDAVSCRFFDVEMRWGRRGLWAYRNAFTMPNAMSFFGCSVGGMSEWGLIVERGSTLNWYGGSIENNGQGSTSSPRGSVMLVTPGGEGACAANFQTHFEATSGTADIHVTAGVDPFTLNAMGCSFNRGVLPSTVHNIYVQGDTGSGKVVVNVQGSAFRHFDGGPTPYTPSASTKYIHLNAVPKWELHDEGAYYHSAVERPDEAGGAAAAKVMFNGTNGAITRQRGVSSVQRLAMGKYRINFRNGVRTADAYHATMDGIGFHALQAFTTDYLEICTYNSSGTLTDFNRVTVTIDD
ncbi:hypothetical protein ACD578_25685 [Microvirga sp. RSM25]|uniref:hypothetical protein n=1 Tax=Microvirga sp. RSM25 TaxID=3273802 RepID=UPI00384CBEF0